MQPTMIVCDGRDAKGNICGAAAEVRRVHYKYVAELELPLGELQQVLSETQYEIECPRCGWRTQVEKIERN
jgi:hypothetical protein